MDFIAVNCFYFVFLIIYYRDINKIFDFLIKKYGVCDFVVNFYFKKIYLLNSTQRIKNILSAKDSGLTYIQKNFNRYLGHQYSVNCLDSNTDKWQHMHTVLKETLNSPDTGMDKIMLKNLPILFNAHKSLNEKIKDYVANIVARFNYGDNVDMKLYLSTQNMIITYIKRFHASRIVRIPVIGAIYAHLMRIYYRSEMQQITKNFVILLNGAHDTAITKFVDKIKDKYNPTETQKIVSETSFLLMLENDFIYTVMMDQLVQPLDTTMEQSIYNGFLYPIRYRNNTYDNGDISANSFVIYNLLNAKLYFSWGPRACVGQSMVKNQIMPVIAKVKEWVQIDRNKNWYRSIRQDNLPEFHNIMEYRFALPEKYIENNILAYSNGTTKIYDLITIYNDPLLMSYIINETVCRLKKHDCNAIISPEARSLPLAGAVSYILQIPLYIIRKKGKIPGDVYKREFNKGYTTEKDVLEIQKINLADKNLAIIDDGIASGGSMVACIELAKMCGGNIKYGIVVVKHTYCECQRIDIPIDHLFKIENY